MIECVFRVGLRNVHGDSSARRDGRTSRTWRQAWQEYSQLSCRLRYAGVPLYVYALVQQSTDWKCDPTQPASSEWSTGISVNLHHINKMCSLGVFSQILLLKRLRNVITHPCGAPCLTTRSIARVRTNVCIVPVSCSC